MRLGFFEDSKADKKDALNKEGLMALQWPLEPFPLAANTVDFKRLVASEPTSTVNFTD